MLLARGRGVRERRRVGGGVERAGVPQVHREPVAEPATLDVSAQHPVRPDGDDYRNGESAALAEPCELCLGGDAAEPDRNRRTDHRGVESSEIADDEMLAPGPRDSQAVQAACPVLDERVPVQEPHRQNRTGRTRDEAGSLELVRERHRVGGAARRHALAHSTVTVFARLRGWSTLHSRSRAIRYANSCNGTIPTSAWRNGCVRGT